MANDQEIKIKLTGQDDASPTIKAAIDRLNSSIIVLNENQKVQADAGLRVNESAEKSRTSLINLAAGVHLVKEAYEILEGVYSKVEAVLEHAVDEALEAEKANLRLTGALQSTGQFSEETAEKIEKYVEALEHSAGANGEAVKAMITTGVQMGLSVKKAAEMEEAARKLAAATGKDVNEAFSLLQGSLVGQTKGLAKLLPQVKEFGEAQLKQGAAIGLVNKKLTESYLLYQDSLPASMSRYQVAVNNVYKALGQIITQNPLLKRGYEVAADALRALEHGLVSANKFIVAHQDQILSLLSAFGKTVAVIGGVAASVFSLGSAFGAAAAIVAGLSAPIATITAGLLFLTSPIALVTAAVVGLTYAFNRWPYLFDYVAAAGKALFSGIITALGKVVGAVGSFASIFNDELSASIMAAKKSIDSFADSTAGSAVKSFEAGESLRLYGVVAKDSHEKASHGAETVSAKNLELVDSIKEISRAYAGINIGSAEKAQVDAGEVQDRDKKLKDFQEYLANRNRLAISAEQEQQLELAKVRADTLKGTGGSAAITSNAQYVIEDERKKQAELAKLKEAGLLNEEQYNQARLASMERYNEAVLNATTAQQQRLAEIGGNSEEAYAAKLALEDQRFQMEMQNRQMRFEQEQVQGIEFNTIKEQAELDHQVRINEIREQQIQNDITRNEKLHNSWAVTLGKIRLEQEKHGKILGTIRGIQNSEEFQGTMGALNNLSSLRNSHSKKAFAIGKAAATAQATVNTFLAATSAYASLAGIPIVGPALGAAAAAAAIAAGVTNIQQIQSQQFGGQADSGMDSVPSPLSGKSFILSQGERVVQPSANKDLKDFLNREKTGNTNTGGGGGYNITLNYNGSGSKEDASKMADILIEEIRSRSEKGTPIMNARGIVTG